MGFASRRIRATWASPVIAYGSPRKCSLHDSGRAGAHARRSFGRIIISSVVGETGAFGQANYAASKSGLHSGLSRSGGLRGHCPWLSACRAAKIPGAPTYSGQRRRSECHVTSFTQVNGCMEWQTGAYCKTVGSAYVGSNPTPATTSENGPLAAETRPGGPFSFCPRQVSPCSAVGPYVAVSTDIWRAAAGRWVGWCAPSAFHGQPRTGWPDGVFPLEVRR